MKPAAAQSAAGGVPSSAPLMSAQDSVRNLHRERVRLIANLHPDRSGSTNTADAFQSVMEAFEELAAI